MERIMKLRQIQKQKSNQNKSSQLSQLRSLFQTSIQVLDSLLRDYQRQANINNEFINDQPDSLTDNSLNSCFQNFYQRLKFILNYKKSSQNNQEFLESLFVDSEQRKSKNKFQNIKEEKPQCDEQLYSMLYQIKAQCQQQKKHISQLNMQLNDKKIQINKNIQYNRGFQLKLKQLQKAYKTSKQTQKTFINITESLNNQVQKMKEELQEKQSTISQLQDTIIQKGRLQDIIMKVNMENVQHLEQIAKLQKKIGQDQELILNVKSINQTLSSDLNQNKQTQNQLIVKLQTETKKRVEAEKALVNKLWLLKNEDKQNQSQLMNQVQKAIQKKLKNKGFVNQCIRKQVSFFVKNVSKLI